MQRRFLTFRRALACSFIACNVVIGSFAAEPQGGSADSSLRCDSALVTDELKASFNASDGARNLNVTATDIEDASPVDAASILANRLDRLKAPEPGATPTIHCKARLKLDNGNVTNAIFRVDVAPSGKQSIVEAPIYPTDFGLRSLAAKPAAAVQPPTAPSYASAPGTARTQSAQSPGVKSGPEQQAVARAAPAETAPPRQLPPQMTVLPLGTVLCSSERDIQTWTTSHKPGASCFHLSGPTAFLVMSRNGTNRTQVQLVGGNFSGRVAWMAAAPSMR